MEKHQYVADAMNQTGMLEVDGIVRRLRDSADWTTAEEIAHYSEMLEELKALLDTPHRQSDARLGSTETSL